jgi:glutamate/tyrosine decarboxylase-like PLP-dependent enzyme
MERSVRYLEGLDERGVAPTEEALSRLTLLDEPLPEPPTHPDEVLRILDEIGSPATLASNGGRFFGFVIGGSLPVTTAAGVLAGAWDQNAGGYAVSPIASVLEEICLKWLVDLFSLPPGTGGGFTRGATMANFTGLAAARHALLAGLDWDVESKGLYGAPPITVIVGDEVHISVLKALNLLGLGRDRVVRVPADSQGRMRADKLPRMSGPTIICAQAGNVNTGAFDPLEEICAAGRDAGAWTHVDGAFGLWAAVSNHRRHLTAGLSHAHSWATDAHKWLNVPYDSGIVLVSDPQDLRAAMSVDAAYLMRGEKRDPSDYVPELSTRARSVETWAALRRLGRSGVADLVERCCRHASRFAQGLRDEGHDVLNDVVLNQVLVSFGSAETTLRVIEEIQKDGTCWCGGTQWQGKTAMRISVSSWATTESDVEKSLTAICRIAARANRP